MSAVTAPVPSPVAFAVSVCTGRTVTSGAVFRVSSVKVLSRVSGEHQEAGDERDPQQDGEGVHGHSQVCAPADP